MREIKFRAWNGRVMLNEDDFHVRYGVAYRYPMFDEPEKTDYPLMQYTGLKDKNGVEIYEGDIVTAHQFLFDGCEVESQIFGEIANGEFGVLLKRIKNEFYEDYTGYEPYEGESYLLNFYGLHEESFEVIGNIYQNPELKELSND